MIYGSWDIKHDRKNFFSFWTIFCPFAPPPPPPNNSENQSFQKMKKTPRDIIILHKRTINGSWDMKCTRRIFFVILGHFFLFYSLKKWKFQKNEKKPWRYHHFTQVYQNSWSYAILFLRYGVWQMYCYFSFWAIFFLFTNEKKWNSPKHENFKKMKKKGLEISFYANHDHILYCSWDMARETCNCYFSFWAIFCPFTSLPTLPDLEISFYTCVPKIMISWCTVPEIWWATDGWTDGRKRWHIEVTFKKAKGVLV